MTAESAMHNNIPKWKSRWNEIITQISDSNSKLTLTLFNPELIVESIFSKYIVYTIRTEQLGHTVRRRFSEFVLLRDILTKTYIGLFIPCLPTDSIFSGNMVSGSTTDIDSDFVRNRTIQLNFFLQQLSNLPFVVTSSIFKTFLSIQDDFKKKHQFNSVYIPPHSSSSVISSNNIGSSNGINSLSITNANNNEIISLSDGEIKWKNFIENYELPSNYNRLINDMKRQLDLLKMSLRSLLEECHQLQKISLVYVRHFNIVSERMNLLQNIEYDISDTHKNELPLVIPELPVLLQASSQSVQYFIKSTKSFTNLIIAILTANIQYQMVQIEGFYDFLKKRDVLLQQINKLEIEKMKLIEENQRIKANQLYNNTNATTTTTSTTVSGTSTSFSSNNINTFNTSTSIQNSIFSLGSFFNTTAPNINLDEVIDRKDQEIQYFSSEAKLCTKALLCCEYDRLHYERCQGIKRLIACMSLAHSQEVLSMNIKWTEIAQFCDINFDEYKSDINMITKIIS